MVNSTRSLIELFEEIEETPQESPQQRNRVAFQRSGKQRFNTERRYARGNSGWSRGGAHQRSGKKRTA